MDLVHELCPVKLLKVTKKSDNLSGWLTSIQHLAHMYSTQLLIFSPNNNNNCFFFFILVCLIMLLSHGRYCRWKVCLKRIKGRWCVVGTCLHIGVGRRGCYAKVMLWSWAPSSAQLAIDNPEIGPAKMMIASTATAFCSEIGCSIPRCAAIVIPWAGQWALEFRHQTSCHLPLTPHNIPLLCDQ